MFDPPNGRGTTVATTTDALTGAARLGRYAPSIHNSQPWRWQVGAEHLDLYLAPERGLAVTDPDARLAVLSCGAALHHAQAALAAEGVDVVVTRMPDPADPDHLARIAAGGRRSVSPDAVRFVQTIEIRHTDRRPVTAEPVTDAELATITDAVNAERTRLYLLPREEIVELAAAASYAQRAESADEAWQAELAYWTGAGIPDPAIPAQPTATTVPSRDFGHPGTLPVGAGHDRAASFAILYGTEDTRLDWLRAGEALSRAWLVATELGLSVVPMSAAVEIPYTRQSLRRLLSGVGEPYLVLRLGRPDPDHPGAPHPPRLPADQVIERVE
jgi:nitroreductase